MPTSGAMMEAGPLVAGLTILGGAVLAAGYRVLVFWRTARAARRSERLSDAEVPLPERDDLSYTQRARREVADVRRSERALLEELRTQTAEAAAAKARAAVAEAAQERLHRELAEARNEARKADARADAAERELATANARRPRGRPAA